MELQDNTFRVSIKKCYQILPKGTGIWHSFGTRLKRGYGKSHGGRECVGKGASIRAPFFLESLMGSRELSLGVIIGKALHVFCNTLLKGFEYFFLVLIFFLQSITS